MLKIVSTGKRIVPLTRYVTPVLKVTRPPVKTILKVYDDDPRPFR